MKLKDKRSKKIIFLSHCLLNQNSRGGAFAVKGGIINELLELFINNNIGISQFPCPELYVWGGVHRKTLYNKQSFVFNSTNHFWFPILEFFIKIWSLKHDNYCKKIAKQEVKRIKDYINEGYEILGCIGIDDSPTCGVTKQVNLIELMKNKNKYKIKLEDLENQKLHRLKEIITKSRTAGTGSLYKHLKKELKKNNLNIQLIGFDPWNDNLKEETNKIKNILKI